MPCKAISGILQSALSLYKVVDSMTGFAKKLPIHSEGLSVHLQA